MRSCEHSKGVSSREERDVRPSSGQNDDEEVFRRLNQATYHSFEKMQRYWLTEAGDEIHLYAVPATNLLILLQDRSQKSQEISIRRSSNEVRTLRGRESCRAEFSPTRQHPF